jgi:hypothetical protein
MATYLLTFFVFTFTLTLYRESLVISLQVIAMGCAYVLCCFLLLTCLHAYMLSCAFLYVYVMCGVLCAEPI